MNMSCVCRNMFLLLLVSATMLATSTSTWSPSDESIKGQATQRNDYEYHTWHVYVVHGMSHSKILFVHCKSADNDLGIHNLTVGSQFEWKLRQNIIHSTLFWCYLASDFGHATFNVFWNDHGFFYKCNFTRCYWIAKDDGVYLKNIPEDYDEFRHKWEPGRSLPT